MRRPRRPARWDLARLVARNADLRRLLVAQLLVYAAESFPVVPLLVLLTRLTGGAAWGAVTLAAGAGALALMLPVAGVVVDRRSRRAVLLGATLAILAAVLVLMGVRSTATVWLAPVAVAAASAAKAFYVPAAQAALPHLVDPADLPVASALTGSTWGTAFVLGSSLGGIVSAAVGPYPCFLLMAAGLSVAAVSTMRIRRTVQPPPAAAVPVRRAGIGVARIVAPIGESMRYIAGQPWVRALMTVKPVVNVGTGMMVIFPLLAIEVFDSGEVGNGLLFAARGAGMVIGPLMLGPILATSAGIAPPRLARILGALMMLYGLACVGIAASPSLAVALVLVLVVHAAGGAAWMASTLALQRAVPDQFRGRVFATDMMLAMTTVTVSQLIIGALVGSVAVRVLIAGCAAVTTVYTVGWVVATRRGPRPAQS